MPRPLLERGPGVVYTKAWVADLMLDLVGYDSALDLGAGTIVEPGCGDGAFLARIVPRLLQSAASFGRPPSSLAGALRGYELDPDVARLARSSVVSQLIGLSVDPKTAEALANEWVVEGDFLLSHLDVSARWVVGNPPYVRVEEAPRDIYSTYRERWQTMSARADIYIGFFEAGLSLLEPGGTLCFICADRWMHNQYGAALRRYVIEDFAMRLLLELHESDVFDVPVAAYPAVTVMQRAAHSSTALATATSAFDVAGARLLARWWAEEPKADISSTEFSASTALGRFAADSSWPSGPPERLRLVAELESRFPALADVGVSIRVGMATGADKVYVVKERADVEPQFLKEAIGPADLREGSVVWVGRYLVSPWDGDELADLDRYPGLRAYFEAHRGALEARYVGKRNPETWWRTIDRPPADEYRSPKLVVADINDRIEPVLDEAGRWPLHSAYYLTSDSWDLEALGGYLLSDVAGAFVEAYSVKMANGHLRVSGQYLKKIRLPRFEDLEQDSRAELIEAFRRRDRELATLAAGRITSSGT